MIFIFGGAYQGKLDYAREKYHIKDDEICFCTEEDKPNFNKKVIYNLEKFIFGCVKRGQEAKDILAENKDLLDDKIIIAEDISQGIVPLDATERQWREMSGRTLLYIGQNASEVIRIFCGLPHKIK